MFLYVYTKGGRTQRSWDGLNNLFWVSLLLLEVLFIFEYKNLRIHISSKNMRSTELSEKYNTYSYNTY